jgi:hypothetical protein
VIESEWVSWVDVLTTAASVWVQGNVRWCAVWGTGWLAGHSTSLARKDRPVRGTRDVGWAAGVAARANRDYVLTVLLSAVHTGSSVESFWEVVVSLAGLVVNSHSYSAIS